MDRRIHRLESMEQLVVGPIYDKTRGRSCARGQFDEEVGAKAEKNIGCSSAPSRIFSSLDELAHPTADEIPDEGDAHSHNEHVEA